MRELGRRTETAVALIKRGLEIAARAVERIARDRERGVGGRRPEILEHAAQRRILGSHAVALFAIEGRDALEQVRKCRHAVARQPREIGAAEEWREVIRREEHRERPAPTSLRQHLVRELVDLVEVGPLLAVHFHVDEQPVHDRGRRLILERLVRHHVAPVTGGVTDREQDRTVELLRPCDRSLAPWIPVNRVCGVLPEIRARFLREPVARPGGWLGLHGGAAAVG